MTEEQQELLEAALTSVVKVFVLVVPYFMLAPILNKVGYGDMLNSLIFLMVSSLLLVLLDFLLQNFLDSALAFKAVYVLLAVAASYFTYLIVYSSFFLILGKNTGTQAMAIAGVQTVLVLYVMYLGFKGFVNTFWDLELS